MAPRHRRATVLLALVLGIAGCGGVTAVGMRLLAHPDRARTMAVDLAAAERGIARAHAWWNPRRRWYWQYLPGTGHSRRASLWGIVHLFGAYNAVALADPTPAHIAADRRFAIGAEQYWNPDLRPVPGYSPVRPGQTGFTWYDDEGWWGVAQFDAYRATHDRRFLGDAARSLRFVDSGWDPVAGGIWWNVLRSSRPARAWPAAR
jgi:hypothetical protein